MDTYPDLPSLLRTEEGLRLTCYDDATGSPIVPGSHVIGHPSIGVGRALDVHGISTGEADLMLENDIDATREAVVKALPWMAGLSPARQMVLIAMAFQMGVQGLLGFCNTLSMVKAGDYASASAGMLASKWAQQTPRRAFRMAEMMRTG